MQLRESVFDEASYSVWYILEIVSFAPKLMLYNRDLDLVMPVQCNNSVLLAS